MIDFLFETVFFCTAAAVKMAFRPCASYLKNATSGSKAVQQKHLRKRLFRLPCRNKKRPSV
jgi:hypothetical protein